MKNNLEYRSPIQFNRNTLDIQILVKTEHVQIFTYIYHFKCVFFTQIKSQNQIQEVKNAI